MGPAFLGLELRLLKKKICIIVEADMRYVEDIESLIESKPIAHWGRVKFLEQLIVIPFQTRFFQTYTRVTVDM